MATPGSSPSLKSAVGKLAKHYGPVKPPPPATAFEWVLWENVAYLADDAERAKAFELLKATVGTAPEKVLKATVAALRAVARHGILAPRFAEKLRDAARIAVEEFAGDLEKAVAGPLPKAKKALRRFPGIGEPGAEKILLFLRRHPSLAADSNGLRALGRLGVIREEKSYAANYQAAQRAAAAELGNDFDVLTTAHRLFRRHGQELCRRSGPLCDACPLRPECRHARSLEGARRRPL